MKKSKYFIVLVIIVLVVIGGIYLGTQRKTSSDMFTTEKNITINDFKNELQKNGFNITQTISKSALLIGAEIGEGYEINGNIIEVYKFNENSTGELTKSNINSAKKEEIVTMPAFNNVILKAKYHKGLCIINYENHPDKEKILEIFNNL